MRIGWLVAFLSCFVLLIVCTSPPKASSLLDSLQSEGIEMSAALPAKASDLNGTEPEAYRLDNEEWIAVYDFGSERKMELGYQRFREHQQVLSSHAPLVYKAAPYLVLYYYNASSATQTAKPSETKYGEKIQKAVSSRFFKPD